MRAAQATRDLWSSYRDLDLAAYIEDRRSRGRIGGGLYRAGEWLVLRRFAVGGLSLGALGVLLLVLLFTGSLGTFYDWLIGWTTEGEPWTHIMRDNPWIFWTFGSLLLIALFKVVPHQAVGRLYLITSAFLVGFLGGHVFWG